MPQFVGSINRYPGRASLAWYAVLILLGFCTLYFVPQCAVIPERPISVLDALFTSTSASCVTGLVVRSTGHDFSFLGQCVIIAQVQLGGIGIMTVTTLILVQFDKRGSLRRRRAVAETLGGGEKGDVRSILRNVLLLTFLCEATGFALLAAYNHMNYERFQLIGLWDTRFEATWHALFHSISAFCNAGFALQDSSLTPFADSWVVNGVIGSLIVVGGLGFPVVNDLWASRRRPRGDRWPGLQLHTKIMLIGTVVLLTTGFVSFLILEADGVLSGAPIGERIIKAGLNCASCRTAGFNSVEVADLRNATLFVIVLMMMIGAGPCSTAGGIKVTTAAIILLRAWASFRGYSRINLFRRTLPPATVERAVATTMLFLVAAGLALTALLVIEQYDGAGEKPFINVSFEVISALGTVGLSTGITGDLSDAGRVLVIVLMVVGRLGPITTFVALSHAERTEPVEFVNEEPLVG